VSDLPPVSAHQAEVARVFFALPEARSFLLAGGLALLAQGMSQRPTQDIDAFTSTPGDVQRARAAFEEAARRLGWDVHERTSTETFVRLSVHAEELVLVDLARCQRPRGMRCCTPWRSSRRSGRNSGIPTPVRFRDLRG